jgi:putative ABC transport system substrate-binding protein
VSNRRDFITLLGGAAAVWPLAAHAQQPAMPVIGFLRSTSSAPFAGLVASFRRGLNEAGLVEGRNVTVDYRWADNQPAQLPALVAELIGRKVAVIVGNVDAAHAAKAATATIPIVFVVGSDPVAAGLVANLNRPGGNLTGVSFFDTPLAAKRLSLLNELLPQAGVIAVLLDANFAERDAETRELSAAAKAIGRQMTIVKIGSEGEFDSAFATIVQSGARGLLVGSGPFFNTQRRRIVALATRHAIPAIYVIREFVEAGGLMSYGASQEDAYRRAGIYVSRVLKGEKPGDLPVELPTKFDLTINIATAKALGLEVPPTLLAGADEVIE